MLIVDVMLAALGLLLLKPFALWLFGLCYEYRNSWKFWPLAAVMAPTDVLFNLTWGSWIFRERPHELTFSGRVRRHLRHDSHDLNTYLEALHWQDELNARWPGHIEV